MEGSRARLVVAVVEDGVAPADGHKWDEMEGEVAQVDTDPLGRNRVDTEFGRRGRWFG